jgi:hypothetical protein
MIISFWSPVHGQTAVTSNVQAVSLIAGMEFRSKVLLTQTHFQYNNLEAPLIGANSSDRNNASMEYFVDIGIDALLRYYKVAPLDLATLDRCCIYQPNTNVLLLPGTTKRIRESFEYEMDSTFIKLLRNIDGISGNVLIDICSGSNSLSRKIISSSDLTVVNLNQNMNVIDLYFNQYHEHMSGKVFYLFGNYDRRSKYNINNIRRKYARYINRENSGVIPYNTFYMDAQCDHRIVDFIKNNLTHSKNEENNYFIVKSKSATEKILKLAGVPIQARAEGTL